MSEDGSGRGGASSFSPLCLRSSRCPLCLCGSFFRDGAARPASSSSMGPEILGRLIDEHAAALTLYARQWCDAPEDVVQEAFLKLVAQRPVPDSPAAWLY